MNHFDVLVVCGIGSIICLLLYFGYLTGRYYECLLKLNKEKISK